MAPQVFNLKDMERKQKLIKDFLYWYDMYMETPARHHLEASRKVNSLLGILNKDYDLTLNELLELKEKD